MVIALLAWLAFGLELSGNWIVGDKQRWGFIVKVFGSITWLAVAVLIRYFPSSINGLIAASILGGLISIRNFYQWRK